MSLGIGRTSDCKERKQLCHFTLERGRSPLLGSFLKLTSKSTPSWSGSKELMFTSWTCLSLPMRIIFASAQMVWSNCCGAGCDYGLTQSEVEIWQPSSLFDLCRQLKESASGFKVQKGCLHWSNKLGCCQICSVLTEHRQPLFIVGSEAAGLSATEAPPGSTAAYRACPRQKGVVGEVFSLSPASLFPLSPNP